MCRWGCAGMSSTFMCKWCGTRYCRECMHGEFHGLMREATICAKCNQKNCQGQKVEGLLKPLATEENGKKGGTGNRSRSSSPAKKGKSNTGSKKSGGKGKSGGKKGGKKKKK